MKDRKFVKNFIWNLIGTSFSSFNSLFFLIIVTWINGIENAGIYSIGVAIALILYTIGEYSGRICQVTDTKSEIKDKDYIFNRIITFCLIVVLGIIIVVFRKYDFYKSSIIITICIYRGLEAFSEVLYGILQKYDYLYKVGQSYTLKSIIGVISFLIIDLFTKNLFFSCISLVIVNMLFIFIFDIVNINKIVRLDYKSNFSNVRKIFKKEFFVFANSFAGVFILNAQKYAIDGYWNDNIQAIYSYIMMPASVINLFTRFVILPFLNDFKKYIKENKIIELKKTVKKIKITILSFGFFCISIAYFIGPEVLSLIYGVKLDMYRINLCFIILAYILYSLSYLDLVVLTTLRNTLIQFIIYIIGMIITFVGSGILVANYEIDGATGACILTLGFLYVAYKIVINKVYKKLL
ncbi:MAG: hypothetical protein J6J60_01785 [Clostridia bacterium]|nr:hypothetical protein [Clostridia bacterium]